LFNARGVREVGSGHLRGRVWSYHIRKRPVRLGIVPDYERTAGRSRGGLRCSGLRRGGRLDLCVLCPNRGW